MSAYLDHAATTAVRPEALAAFLAASDLVGNPSSTHAAGRDARRTVEDAREELGAALRVPAGDVVLTAGGTEADNLAVTGLYRARRSADARRTRVLVSAVEHPAVLDTAHRLSAREGAEVVELPVDPRGLLVVEALEAELAAHAGEVALISVMWANNEVGSVQPVAEVASLAERHGIPVHSDAVQAVGHVPVDASLPGLAALSVSGHKLGAPGAAGALVLRRDVAAEPVLHGGGQERGVRSGTVSAAAAAGLAAAARAAVGSVPGEASRLAGLRDRLLAGLLDTDGVALCGPPPGRSRLPGNAHVVIEGVRAEVLLFLLDAAGVAASSGSACRAGVEQASHVLLAMGVPERLARGALRFTLGHTSRAADVDAVLDLLPDAVVRARAASGVF